MPGSEDHRAAYNPHAYTHTHNNTPQFKGVCYVINYVNVNVYQKSVLLVIKSPSHHHIIRLESLLHFVSNRNDGRFTTASSTKVELYIGLMCDLINIVVPH